MAERAPLLDPLLVAKMATMELRAKSIVDGALSGRHRSAQRGHALEFAGHRAYSPSDEWRRIDWKVYSRTDRWVVREQQEETNLRATVLLDASRSMGFAAGGRLTKFRYASFLAAALGYLLIHRRESVGLGLFREALDSFVPARGGAAHLSFLLNSLEAAAPGGGTDLAASLGQAGQRMPRRGLVALISDFLSPPETVLASVRLLQSHKHEVAALQVLDPAERDLSLGGDFIFEDMESGERVAADARDIAASYRELMSLRQEKLRRGLASLGADFHSFGTDRPLDEELAFFLHKREG